MAWQGLKVVAPLDLLRMAVLVPPLGILALSGDWWGRSPLEPLLDQIWIPLALAAAVTLGFGYRIYWRALLALGRLRVRGDSLLALGFTAGLALAFWQAWRLPPDASDGAMLLVWRDAAFAASLVAVVRLGDLVAKPDPVAPRGAKGVVGATLTVPAGDLIPVDAVVRDGRSEIQDTHGTDDIFPTVVGPGDRVHTGARNGDAALVIAPLPKAADPPPPPHHESSLTRIVGWAALGMLLLAFCVLGWRYLTGPAFADPLASILRLVMLSAPLGLGVALAAPAAELLRATRALGIEVHDLGSFERVLSLRSVVFGHRGVLIPDRHRVISVQTPDGDHGSELIARAASVAQAGNDPWGRALLDLAVGYRMRLKNAVNYRAVIGDGIVADIAECPVYLGTRDFLIAQGIDCKPLDEAAEEATAQGRRLRWVGEGGANPKLLGFVVFGAPSVAGAAVTVKNLDRLGLATAWLADGNDPGHQVLAKHLKLDHLLPMDDAAIAEALASFRKRHGPLLYVTAEPLAEAGLAALGPADLVLPFGRRATTQWPLAPIAITRQDPRLIVDILMLASRYRRLAFVNLALVFAAAAVVAFAPVLMGTSRDLASYEIAVILLLAVSSLGLRALPSAANEVDEE